VQELLPGLFHWTAVHPRIRIPVHSHFVRDDAMLLDPMAPPDDGLEWFERGPRPEQIVLTIRHHWRESDRFVEAFGCRVRAHRAGLHEFEGTDREVEAFEPGDRLSEHVTAREAGAISPDDVALHVELHGGVLVIGDAVHRMGGEIGFMPDHLLGDDPEEDRRAIAASLRRLVDELDFDHVLLAHGDPIVGGGKRALERFLAESGER